MLTRMAHAGRLVRRTWRNFNLQGKIFEKLIIENFGVDQKYAEETWKEIENMADYQFNHCVSGKTVILRGGRANKYIPTVEEMYKIRNSYEYAKETGHLPLRVCIYEGSMEVVGH